MIPNLRILIIFSIMYLILLGIGLSIFIVFFKMKATDAAVISNIFVWSATLFAPITAFFIFEGWKTQHNKSAEQSLAEGVSLNLNIIKENLGQIYFIMYLNKITHPHFFPVNNEPLPEYILKNILNFNEEVIKCTTHLNKDLDRLSRKNAELKNTHVEYDKEYNNLHRNLFYFVDLKMQGKLPDIDKDSAKQKFFELYDHYHSFSAVCEKLDATLDNIIFI